MSTDDISKRALQLFQEGYHCSQAIFHAGCEMLSKEPPSEALSILAPFAGGMACTGRVCGCLAGALAVIGLISGKSSPTGRNHRQMIPSCQLLIKRFVEITKGYGGIDCSDIARVDWSDRDQVKKFRTDPSSRRKECVKVLDETARALKEILERIR